MKEQTTKVIACHCKHEWQDKKYGIGRRLANLCGKLRNQWRCTVCGHVHG